MSAPQSDSKKPNSERRRPTICLTIGREISNKLDQAEIDTGTPKSQLVEAALRFYFDADQGKVLKKTPKFCPFCGENFHTAF